MGTAHKVISACLRVFEFGCCVIILGILARFFYTLNRIDGPSDSRLVYAISIAAISVALTIILLPPLKYSFHFFPIDFALFICWIVCFALLEDLTGTNTCTSGWFSSYWAVYSNPDTGDTTVVTRRGCSRWRVVLAFSFIVAFAWLLSGFLGCYACAEYHDLDARIARMVKRLAWWKKPKQPDLEKSAAEPREQQLLPKVGPPSTQASGSQA
ncbi:hypothetical protein C8A03DRAFT_35836 [Achaetomium macrosporum]|uniref:MARVEL domain-containing protein n=1 Tax=Achaetomium macrosporum TaxID=79813 RepID=A0AAN7HCI6_9PEZI|nr:hypothetical protein C8A03DRAFT_35836 [Achaetomium macrosporum]